MRNWRAANAWAPAWWYELEGAAYSALRKRDSAWVEAERIAFAADDYGLAMRLPSGRQLRYPFAKFEWQRISRTITYLKAAWKPKANVAEWPRATHVARHAGRERDAGDLRRPAARRDRGER